MLTKAQIKEHFNKEVDGELLKKLNHNSKLYEKNMDKIKELLEIFPEDEARKLEEYGRCILKEHRLNSRDAELRKEIGIYIPDPCKHRKCEPYRERVCQKGKDKGKIKGYGCEHLTDTYFCRRFKMRLTK